MGDGIGGVCLAIGLLEIPSLTVHIYEAARCFSELGAGIVRIPQQPLSLFGVAFVILDVVTPKPTGLTRIWAHTLPEHSRICSASTEIGQKSFHRAKFLERPAALVPSDVVTFSKRLGSLVEHNSGRVTMGFQDGSTASADCVVGADGLHGRTRRYLFAGGELGWKDCEPRFTKIMVYCALVPMNVARAAHGDDIALSSTVIMGRNTLLVSYQIDFGETFNMALCDMDVSQVQSMHATSADFEHVHRMCNSWSPKFQKMVQLIDNPMTLSWPLFETPQLPTYARSRVRVMGDAAHAKTPFNGAGAGQAIEDAYMLQTLFAQVKTPRDVGIVLQAYDLTRRPRSHQVVAMSRQAGEIYALRDREYGGDVETTKRLLPTKIRPVWDVNLKAAADEARTRFHHLQVKWQ